MAFVAVSVLVMCTQHTSSLCHGLAASASGKGLKLRGLIYQKINLQLLLFVKESAWTAFRGSGIVS